MADTNHLKKKTKKMTTNKQDQLLIQVGWEKLCKKVWKL